MKKQIKKLIEGQLLRQKAEDLYKARVPGKVAISNESDVLKLNHELSVHQIELEIQNAELLRAKEELEIAVEKYTDLYDFAPTGYLTLSGKGQITGLNLCASKMLGKERSRLMNSMFGTFITEDTKKKFYLFLKEIFDLKIEESCEVALIKDDNIPIFVYLIGLISKDGNSCDITMIDITERKVAEAKMDDLLNKLSTSNKELADFAYVAAHDLQEPLRMVTSFMQLLSLQYKDKLDDKAQEYIHFAVEGAKRMYDLLNGLLFYSRIQTKGKDFGNVDTNRILSNVINNLAVIIKERGAEIKIADLPVLFGDETQITQLFQNLIANSIKFSTEPPLIYISAKSDSDHYVFSVRDEGIGIESQYFERIFVIFQRLMPREQYDGIGAGLAICKRIVERHGGRIWVVSEIGKGSTFFFTFLKRGVDDPLTTP